MDLALDLTPPDRNKGLRRGLNPASEVGAPRFSHLLIRLIKPAPNKSRTQADRCRICAHGGIPTCRSHDVTRSLEPVRLRRRRSWLQPKSRPQPPSPTSRRRASIATRSATFWSLSSP